MSFWLKLLIGVVFVVASACTKADRTDAQGEQLRPHRGVDYIATPGQDVFAVTDGTISRIGHPYANDLSYKLIEISTSDGYVVRQFYVEPAPGISKGASVSAGQVIGTYQSLRRRYPGVENVHVEIYHYGNEIDPTPLIPLPSQ